MKQQYEKKELQFVAMEKRGFHGFPTMFHPHAELLYVLEGQIPVCVDSMEHTLGPGEACLVLPYVLHSYEDAPAAAFRLIMISPQYLFGMDGGVQAKKMPHPFYEMDDALDELSAQSVRHMQNGEAFAQMTARGYAVALIGTLLQRSSFIDAPISKRTSVENVLVYCNEHFLEPISIPDVAAACYISESLVSKIFSNEIGTAFRTYINSLRVDHARKLLEKTDRKITEIQFACGFQNQTSFNRVFFDLCGQTPKQYRQQCPGRGNG